MSYLMFFDRINDLRKAQVKAFQTDNSKEFESTSYQILDMFSKYPTHAETYMKDPLGGLLPYMK